MRIYLIGALGLCICATAALGCSFDFPIWSIRDNSADPLYRYVVNDKVGYIDSNGKIVIRPTFRSYRGNVGDEFHEGLLEVFDVGYVDTKGKAVIKKVSDSEFDFSDGLASFTADHLYGFIDRKGRVVIKPQYKVAGSFSNGLAVVEAGERAGYIGKDGNFAIGAAFFRGRSFHEERAWVVAEGPCRWQRFYDEMERLKARAPTGQEMAVLGDSCFGSYTLPASSEEIQDIQTHCRYALIDKTGVILSSERYDDVQDFAEGLAPVKIGKLWGFADRSGKTAIAPQFAYAAPFSEGFAAVSVVKGGNSDEPLFGYIAQSGAFVISPQFKKAESFSEGLAVVHNGDVAWYIDRSGKSPIAKKFGAAGRFFRGLAHVELNHFLSEDRKTEEFKYAYIDRSGKIIFTYTDRRD